MGDRDPVSGAEGTETDPADDEAQRKLVANERVKYSATYANGLAVAIFSVSGLAPLVSKALSDNPRFAPVPFIWWFAGL